MTSLLSRLVFSPRRVCSLTKTCPIKSVNIINLRLMRECVCAYLAHSLFGPILRIHSSSSMGARAPGPLLQHVECEARPAINFKYPFYGPITAPCFAIPLNIGPGRVSSSYLATLLCCNIAANEISFIVLPAVIKFTYNIKLFRTYAHAAALPPQTHNIITHY